MSSTLPTSSKQGKLILILFLLILIGPFAFAYFLVQKGQALQLRSSQHGDLISAPLNIAGCVFYDPIKKLAKKGESLKGKWHLAYISPTECTQDCLEMLHNLRQIQSALGRNASRMEPLFIAFSDLTLINNKLLASPHYATIQAFSMELQNFDSILGAYSNALAREQHGELYIIDPHGNIMMHYDAHTQARAMLSDLKRLLKVSKIG